VDGVGRLEAITKVEGQADSVDEASSKKQDIEEGELAIKKPRVDSFFSISPLKISCSYRKKVTMPQRNRLRRVSRKSWMKQNQLHFKGGLKWTSLEENESISSHESVFKWTKVVKSTKHGSKVVKKELPKSMSSCKKERGVKAKKQYKENNDEYFDEIELTGSRKLVEVYQEDFDDNLTDDAGHKSLEKEGNCTVIQKANAALMAKFGKAKVGTGHLQNIYSKEKCSHLLHTLSRFNGRVLALSRSPGQTQSPAL
jgi:hypothetical protein